MSIANIKMPQPKPETDKETTLISKAKPTSSNSFLKKIAIPLVVVFLASIGAIALRTIGDNEGMVSSHWKENIPLGQRTWSRNTDFRSRYILELSLNITEVTETHVYVNGHVQAIRGGGIARSSGVEGFIIFDERISLAGNESSIVFRLPDLEVREVIPGFVAAPERRFIMGTYQYSVIITSDRATIDRWYGF